MAEQLAFRFKQKGIKYQANDSTRDLGISFANSPKGKRQLINQRAKQASKTLVEIQSIANISRKKPNFYSQDLVSPNLPGDGIPNIWNV